MKQFPPRELAIGVLSFTRMEQSSAANHLSTGLPLRPGERRKNVRFAMSFRVFLRALGDPWTSSETADVSAAGAFFVTERPYLLNTPIEYVLTFPKELTKAPSPLRMRFFASVIRCERIPGGGSSFGVAVRNTAHRYLTPAEATQFDSLDQRQDSTIGQIATVAERKTGT